jgi:hypothetical protein
MRRQPASRAAYAFASDDADVLSFVALAAASSVELDPLAFLERLVTVTLDRRKVNEHVVTLIAGDEAVALLGIEKLDSALCPTYSFRN